MIPKKLYIKGLPLPKSEHMHFLKGLNLLAST